MRPSPLRFPAAILLVFAAFLAAPAPALAATTADVVALTKGTYEQTCAALTASVRCTGPSSRVHMWEALISPLKGPVVSLRTDSAIFGAPPLDVESRTWMNALHGLVCGDDKGVAAFVAKVAALGKPATVAAETVGICRMSGSMSLNAQDRELYRVTSAIRVQPTPTPEPTASPAPTASPTSRPTIAPTGQPTVKPTSPPTPRPTTNATAKAVPTGPTPTAASSGSVGPSPSVRPSPSPEATVEPTPAPATPGPTPSTDPGAATLEPIPAATEPPGAAGATPEPSLPAWEESVLGIVDVNADGDAIGGSLLLALLLLLVVGFIGELFNNTVENNYHEIAGWFRKGPLGRARAALTRVRFDPPGVPGVWLFIALTALVSSFVDPGFGLNVRSIAVFLGFLVGLVVVLASFKLPPILARRRRTGELGKLRPLPWALVIAALFVLVSRLANLQPGYLYGIVLGAIFVTDASDRDEGRETFWGSLWTLGAAVVAWIALTWIRGFGLPADGFGVTLLSTAFAATLVAGLEAAAFALMPMRFLPGYVLYKWNRPAWAVLWAVSLFAFFHILIGPTSGYVSELSPQGFLAALGVFAAFGALSIGTWLYFRFRTPSVAATAE
ncbi:MAG TPA: FGLLP motif-containing membrane protein [Candidatus Limnocylindrales bacterium]|nr:FGLLP motif-containing membrane protein [Candidatus Limnocylindrales bacterium]